MPKQSILIVEDDLFLQQIYVKSLEEAGYAVAVAMDGKEALDKLKESRWDMVLLDLNLPVVPGLQVLETMSKDESLKKIPVIVLTNYSEEQYAQQCASLGAKAFFTKSNLSFEDILFKVKQLIRDSIPDAAEKDTPASAPSAATATSTASGVQQTEGSGGDAAAEGGEEEGEQVRILVVEDDPFLLELYKQNLLERGYDVEGVSTGSEALALLETDQNRHLIILDLLMPEMDGFTVLDRLRERGISQKIPVIVLTNLSQENDQKKAMELGAVDFAIKSELSFDEIVARVENVLKKHSS